MNKDYKDESNNSLAKFSGAAYTVMDALGVLKKGVLDKQGHAKVAGLATGPATVKIAKDTREPWQKPQDFGKYVWPKDESAVANQTAGNASLSFIDTVGNLASQAAHIVGAVAGVTGSRALGNIAQGLGATTGLASGLSSGGAVGLFGSALGVAGNYVPSLAGASQAFGAAQGLVGLANGSGALPAPSSDRELGQMQSVMINGGGFTGGLKG